MVLRRASLAAVLVLTLAAAVASAGCAGRGSAALPPGEAAPSAGTGASDAATAPPVAADGATSDRAVVPEGKDSAAIDAQLNAMQKELDSLAMPDDKDFDAAAGAVY